MKTKMSTDKHNNYFQMLWSSEIISVQNVQAEIEYDLGFVVLDKSLHADLILNLKKFVSQCKHLELRD